MAASLWGGLGMGGGREQSKSGEGLAASRVFSFTRLFQIKCLRGV